MEDIHKSIEQGQIIFLITAIMIYPTSKNTQNYTKASILVA